MRLTDLFLPTLRDDPSEAEVASHRLLLRAGFIRQLMAGVYTILPMGLRTMQRIERIVREEMDGAGAQEVRVPIVLPAEPWKATGRWGAYGELLFKSVDRHGRELLLGPTHEEVVSDLVRQEVKSYRQLPLNLYQIQTKFRDEVRPRFGLMRAKEFLMRGNLIKGADAARMGLVTAEKPESMEGCFLPDDDHTRHAVGHSTLA